MYTHNEEEYMFGKEKCQYCKRPIEEASAPVSYRDRKGKNFQFCTDDCAQNYQEMKGIYLQKNGGLADKVMGGLNSVNSIAQGVNDLLGLFR